MVSFSAPTLAWTAARAGVENRLAKARAIRIAAPAASRITRAGAQPARAAITRPAPRPATALHGAERRTKRVSMASTSWTNRAEASPRDRLSDSEGGAAARLSNTAGRMEARARKAAA